MSYTSKEYEDRSDIEKIQSNWKKLSGLYSRNEWSSSIVRAATTAEIASNLVVREELENIKGIDEPFVSHLMMWANGIQGKFQKLILPAVEGKDYALTFKQLSNDISDINRIRNGIVHAGKFADYQPAHDVIVKARTVILTFVCQYHNDFNLDEINKIQKSHNKSIQPNAKVAPD
ncbi:hypothetical protein ABMA57_02075 [Saccharospirillum sp. HFRX-1]|uniref:hypothetical protein n=1 Tax=unclassified Saccharospirillum TaxID=2633430 RepID=UPI0037173793